MTPKAALIADMHATVAQDFDIVLKPISHPELGEIRIDESLFAIGRTEPPFESYAPEIVTDLSRRHARIFCEYGAVYIADLGSKNGTTVNGLNVQQKIAELHDGDEVCFGKALSYRVKIGTRATAPTQRTEKLMGLTLTPERSDLGLQPIIITRFPFLISKADDTFARYRDSYPHQVNYLSRRHAHIFLKSGLPYVEDLGSTNGTFVLGKRLDEHARPLNDNDTLAFGGHHFVYKVSLQKEEPRIDLTMTKISPPQHVGKGHAEKGPLVIEGDNNVLIAPALSPIHDKKEDGAIDKTTFVAAADSFLDIFCIDNARQQDEEVNHESLHQPSETEKKSDKRRKRSKFTIFASELTEAFTGNDQINKARAMKWGLSLAALLGILFTTVYFMGSFERDLKDLIARGDYAQAAAIAHRKLEQNPNNTELKSLSVEALLKANVPRWLNFLQSRQFDQANHVLANMKQLGSHNEDAQSLIGELEWVGNLETFVIGRGGTDAPINIFADEEKIKALLKRWDEDTSGHQRAFTTISSYVPEFKDRYAEALSHLRKLQSDDAVYVTAMERLKSTISTELDRDHAEILDAVLKDYAEKYPRMGGLDNVRQDLQRYIDIGNAVRERKLSSIITFLTKERFVTQPFQAKFRALASGNQFPTADVIRQYREIADAWKAGNANQAFAGLEQMTTGAWADAASNELNRKKAIADQFTTLQQSRGSQKHDNAKYDERLLAFYGSLDPNEDTYFIRAIEPDINAFKDQAIARATELLNRSNTSWRDYRENGAIEGKQRLDTEISNQFRTQAKRLADAYRDMQQGMQIYAQLKVAPPAQWKKVRDEVNAEEDLQRKSLTELRTVLKPKLLKAKLALLGDEQSDGRQAP